MPKQLQSQLQPRAAAMGYQCDAVWKNPNYDPDDNAPLLLRCHDPATLRMVIVTPDDAYQIKRCEPCAEVLRAKVQLGATFEIISEEAL